MDPALSVWFVWFRLFYSNVPNGSNAVPMILMIPDAVPMILMILNAATMLLFGVLLQSLEKVWNVLIFGKNIQILLFYRFQILNF
jgi:hypothetical protein